MQGCKALGYPLRGGRTRWQQRQLIRVTAAQSLRIVHEMAQLKALGVALLVGHSRKSFLKEWGGAADRDAATLEVSRHLMAQGVEYIRVHDVAAHAALRAGQ
ncbi:MAG: hypothetical protein EBV03_11850 [Proteobacteria bacterium]|nr:hypothetical protein [Pseudomonadota bacterium]